MCTATAVMHIGLGTDSSALRACEREDGHDGAHRARVGVGTVEWGWDLPALRVL